MTAQREPCAHPDTWFSRSICAYDDYMHTYCRECGAPLDGLCATRVDFDEPDPAEDEAMRDGFGDWVRWFLNANPSAEADDLVVAIRERMAALDEEAE